MLTLSDVALSHGARTLFRDVSLQVLPGRRIGLVGPNGAGKTTLLEIMAGQRVADAGRVNRAKGIGIGWLRQEVAEMRGGTVLEEVTGAAGEVTELADELADLEHRMATGGPDLDELLARYGHAQDRFQALGGYDLGARAEKVLAGLGFASHDMHRRVDELSGGWMMRIGLARILLAAPDVLLLDEPTNHLDLDSVRWLEGFLSDYDGAQVIVSHDRDFLNAVVNRIVELDEQTAVEYVGDYATFVEQRALRREQQAAAAANQQRKVAETERFIERFRYKASKARQVQSRVKSLERMERVEQPVARRRVMRFGFPDPPRSGRVVVRLESVAKSYNDRVVYTDLDLTLERGQKAVLVGPNGAGKSTLLKMLAGRLSLDEGSRVLGHNVQVAYYGQHQVDDLDLDATVLEQVAGVVDTSKVNPRSMLGAFRFSGDDVDKRVAVLSGGERARLALCRLLAHPVNLLCMDEPTNHLDMASRDVLEEALAEYPGTVVLITHDRHLIRSVADTVVEVADGTATVHLGDYEDYLERTGRTAPPGGMVDARGPSSQPAGAGASAGPRSSPATDRRRTEARRREQVHRATAQLKRRLAAVERDLVAAEARVAELTRELADPEVYTDGDRVAALASAHHEAKDAAADLFVTWERLATELEQATARAAE